MKAVVIISTVPLLCAITDLAFSGCSLTGRRMADVTVVDLSGHRRTVQTSDRQRLDQFVHPARRDTEEIAGGHHRVPGGDRGDVAAGHWQTGVVRLIGNALRFPNHRDRTELARAIKPVYTAPDEEATKLRLEAFRDSEV